MSGWFLKDDTNRTQTDASRENVNIIGKKET